MEPCKLIGAVSGAGPRRGCWTRSKRCGVMRVSGGLRAYLDGSCATE